jgi:hypothetical protein
MADAEIYKAYNRWANATVVQHPDVISSAVAEAVVQITGPYHDNDQPYTSGAGATWQPGNKPYFIEDIAAQAPVELDFAEFVGRWQALNDANTWSQMMETPAGQQLVHDIKAEDVWDVAATTESANEDLFGTTLVLSGTGAIFGNKLPEVTTSYDQTYLIYPAVLTAVSGFEGVTTSPDETRQRMLTMLGTTDSGAGTLFTALERVQRPCPSRDLTGKIFAAFGDAVKDNAIWTEFKAGVYSESLPE